MSNIPCGTQYPGCKFIRDAHVAVARKPELEIEKEEATEQISQVSEDLAALKPDEVNKKLEKYIKDR